MEAASLGERLRDKGKTGEKRLADLFERSELVVVGGEEGAAAVDVVEMLRDRPG